MKHNNTILKSWIILVFLLFLSSCTKIQPISTDLNRIVSDEEPIDFSYDSYAQVLSTHVDGLGQVNYERLVADPTKLNEFYAQIATFSPDSHPTLFPTESHRLAYWINAYNATVLKGVVEYYPIDSVEDVQAPAILFFFPSKSGFFFFQRFTYGGQETSLYYLENSVIRKRFNEPRIHFALNCASQSCPLLPQIPFTGESLENQLDRETRKFINDQSKVRYDVDSNTLYLSSIFKWYEEDFTDWLRKTNTEEDPSLLSYVLLYLTPEKAKNIRKNKSSLQLAFLTYDWGLNAAK